MCSSWVENPLFFLICLGVCTRIPPQEHLMKEQSHCTLGDCPGTSANGVTVSIYIDYSHPLLHLKSALPWDALFEVMRCHGRRAGKNPDGRPGLPWDVAL